MCTPSWRSPVVPPTSTEGSLPEPPELKRRSSDPRALGIMLVLAALPAWALVGRLNDEAQLAVIQVLIGFAVLMVVFRLIGKRELSRMSPFELVTLMLIPEILSSAVQGQGSIVPGLAALCTVLILVLATSLLVHRFPRVQSVVEAEPTLLVENGRLLEDAFNRERLAPDELFAEMRKRGVCDLSEVRFAVLESSGELSFVLRAGKLPIGGGGGQQ
jgi:uncharacterized membrane protein YcaP (DUF421 family)